LRPTGSRYSPNHHRRDLVKSPAGRPLDAISDPLGGMNDVACRKSGDVAAYRVDLRASTAGEVALTE
jgi:hypothetical protein